MSAESAHLSTFGAETETEAEIRWTSNHTSLKRLHVITKTTTTMTKTATTAAATDR